LSEKILNLELPEGISGFLLFDDQGKVSHAEMPEYFTPDKIKDTANIISLTVGHEREGSPTLTELIFDYTIEDMVAVRYVASSCIIAVLCARSMYGDVISTFIERIVNEVLKTQNVSAMGLAVLERLKKSAATLPQQEAPVFAKEDVENAFRGGPETDSSMFAERGPIDEAPISLIFFQEVQRILMRLGVPDVKNLIVQTVNRFEATQSKFPRGLRAEFLSYMETLLEEGRRKRFRQEVTYISDQY